MKTVKSLDQHEMIERGLKALYKELGPIEARRFIAYANSIPREDSVKRHHRWQNSLDKKAFVKKIMRAQRG